MKMTAKTGNGAPAHAHSQDNLLEFFSKGGSIRSGKTYHKEAATDVLEIFKLAWFSGNEKDCMKLLLWARDCRGGAGNRQVFRDAVKWLAETSPEWIKANIHLIPLYGRWDDLASLYGTDCEAEAVAFWADTLASDDKHVVPLAAKWADRQDVKLRTHMKLTPKAFRKLVVEKTGWVVEKSMCSGNWEDIPFSSVPSVASARYRKAFKEHQKDRYEQWCLSLANTKKVNASVLFPHDVVRLVHSTYDKDAAFKALADAMFENLPNYIAESGARCMPICDFSGSMNIKVSGEISAMDVSLALGLYCGDKLGKDNPYYRKLIPFSASARLESWQNMSVVDAIRNIPDGYCGNTNIQSALDKLLETAKFFNVPADKMVNKLIILSDMQWDPHSTHGDDSVIDACMKKWTDAGYEKPAIVYWNLHAYGNQPETKKGKNVALVSGFSPSILKTVLTGKNITPLQVMQETIAKYEVVEPK